MFATRALAAGALLAVTAGCSDRSTVSGPIASGYGRADLLSVVVQTTTSVAKIVHAPILLRSNLLLLDLSTTAVIGPAGGMLEIPSAGVRVTIPADALSAATLITVTAPAGGLVVYTFAPHGLQFAKPITIAQDLGFTQTGGNGSGLLGGYLPNGAADIIGGLGAFTETFGVTIESSGSSSVASFGTTHFSGYALASGRSESQE